MAGKRQHSIPRFLQKGFASRIEGEDVFVWVYRKDGTGAEINTKNVGVERFFYGKPGAVCADDEITDLESEYCPLLDELRSKSGQVINPKIPGLIAHLSTRTRYLRKSFADITGLLLKQIHERLRDPRVILRLLAKPIYRERLIEELVARGASSEQATGAMELVGPHLPQLLEPAIPDMVSNVDSMMDFAKSKFPEAIPEAHIKALLKNPSAHGRSDTYAAFSWFVLRTESPLILGDSLCLFETSGDRRFKPLDDKGDDVLRVFLPISATLMLIGTPFRKRPKLDSLRINEAAAKCSAEFFISSTPRRLESSLVSSIGRRAGILSDEEVDKLINEITMSLEHAE